MGRGSNDSPPRLDGQELLCGLIEAWPRNRQSKTFPRFVLQKCSRNLNSVSSKISHADFKSGSDVGQRVFPKFLVGGSLRHPQFLLWRQVRSGAGVHMGARCPFPNSVSMRKAGRHSGVYCITTYLRSEVGLPCSHGRHCSPTISRECHHLIFL